MRINQITCYSFERHGSWRGISKWKKLIFDDVVFIKLDQADSYMGWKDVLGGY